MNFKETEQKIKDYYESLKVVEGLKHRLEIYENRKKDLENKINNSVIYLNDDFKAVNYNKINTENGGIKISPQEKAVDKAFTVLERNLENVKAKILLIQEQINNIETENSVMALILKGLKPEYEKIIEALYKYNKKTLQISIKYNMDKSTVSRKKDKVIKDVMKWINFYN